MVLFQFILVESFLRGRFSDVGRIGMRNKFGILIFDVFIMPMIIFCVAV
jgi:hypothetical protein